MKKFLAVLLIAFISCSAIEDISLEGPMRKAAPNISNISSAIDFLKGLGVYEQIKKAAVNVGKALAISHCSKFVPQDYCQQIVENLE